MADFNAASLETDFRYVVVDWSFNEIGEIHDIVDGSITRNALSDLKESATLNYENTFELASIGNNLVRVYFDAGSDVDKESLALGTFIVSTPTQTISDTGTSGSATCYSLLKVLQDSHLDSFLTVPSGTNVVEYAKAIITGANLRCNATPSAYVTSSDCSFQAGEDTLLDVVNWCLNVANYSSPRLDGYGTVILKPYTPPSEKTPVRTYDESSKVMFPSMGHELDGFSVPNKVVVVSSNQDSCFIGTAVNDNPSSRYSTVSRGRVISAVYNEDGLASQSAADERARILLSEQSAVESVDVEHLYDGSNIDDVIAVKYAGSDIQSLCVTSQEITLDIGCPVKDHARRFIGV